MRTVLDSSCAPDHWTEYPQQASGISECDAEGTVQYSTVGCRVECDKQKRALKQSRSRTWSDDHVATITIHPNLGIDRHVVSNEDITKEHRGSGQLCRRWVRVESQCGCGHLIFVIRGQVCTSVSGLWVSCHNGSRHEKVLSCQHFLVCFVTVHLILSIALHEK